MEPTLYGQRIKNPLLIAVLSILFLFLLIYILNPMTVTVVGSGEVGVSATNATVSFTLSGTDANSPQNAIANVNTKALSMREFLKGKGVAENDIAQSEVSAVPNSFVTAGGSGYQATISMAAKTKQVNNISGMVSDLYSQGALVVTQPVLSVENQNELDQKAFNAALGDAKKQAARIGFSNLKFIRKIVGVTTATSPATSTSTTRPDAATVAAGSLASGNGVFKIVKAVSVTYRMW